MRTWFSLGEVDVPSEENSSPRLKIRDALPPILKSQYDGIYVAILQTNLVLKEIASIIALYSLSAGYLIDFRLRYFYYTNFNGEHPTAITYNDRFRDFQNALLDFSFRGRCMIRFKIRRKSDEMWLGVVGDPKYLDEEHTERGAKGQWAFYCGRSRERYYFKKKTVPREQMLDSFEPVLNCEGIIDGGYGSFHFPQRILHRLVPCNTGDVVDLDVDAQEKTFTVIVNGVFQASTKAPDLPEQLAFFVQLDATDDCVEFEILDFKFEKRKKLKIRRNAKVGKCVESS